ncbi:MAG: site-2 protease family protein [Methanotrichaceae archaeon]|nr:site-2 protease family protein [Methanotrichaceae archaeon]
MDWLLIIAITLSLASLALLPLRDSDTWKKRGISTWGTPPLIVFFRSTRGLGMLDFLSWPKTLWRGIATAGVPLVVLSMAYFLALLMLMTVLMIKEPPEPGSYNAPRNILLIPGLNEYVPFVWGWIALFVTMFVHEFAHGILCRVEGVRVKSMGIVTFLVAPIAAFVEPDDEDLFGTDKKSPIVSKGARIRILSAGVISNFLVALLAFALFFGPVIGALEPVDRVIVVDVKKDSPGEIAGFYKGMIVLGSDNMNIVKLEELYSKLQKEPRVKMLQDDQEKNLDLKTTPVKGVMVASVFDGSPAEVAGLAPSTIIIQIDEAKIDSLRDFKNYMNTTQPNQIIILKAADGNTYNVMLTSKENGKGFMGIGISGDALYASGVAFQQAPTRQFLAALKAIPNQGMQGFAYLLSLPFTGIPGFTEKGFPGFSGWIINVYQPTGWAEVLGEKYFWIANLLLWIGWINLYAGLFNCLPAVPLDGGHIFRDLVQSGFERFVNMQKAERLTRTVVAVLAWLVLTSIAITVFAPFTHGI